MNRYDLISFLALLTLVIALPIYGAQENSRMEHARQQQQWQLITEAGDIYLAACAGCHGLDGAGVGDMPALNSSAMARSSHDFLYQAIAGNSSGQTMTAWHLNNDGPLNSYQIEQLVALIQKADWTQVTELAQANSVTEPAAVLPSLTEPQVVSIAKEPDPHECRACHQEPPVHAGQFGQDCARCHTLAAWTPAYLTRHIFPLDHGAPEKLACETCHAAAYTQHTCTQCHDHQPDEMVEVHEREGITDFADCVACHPTGQPGEADRLRRGHEPAPADGPASTAQLTPPFR
jgi:mono/diheme cytochrome c family protein